MVETTPQLSSNSSSNLETSAIGEKEKQIRKDEKKKCLEVIYNSGLKNPEVSFTDFLSFARLVHNAIVEFYKTGCRKWIRCKIR